MLALLLLACGAAPDVPGEDPTLGTSDSVPTIPAPVADVVGVSGTGTDGAYTVSVTIRSDETGCDQYADWWEILTPAGALVYRRILTHSHPDEQPFTRASEEPVAVTGADELVVRAHLHPTGYGGEVMRGTLAGGFVSEAGDPAFAAELEAAPPQPDGCLF